MICGMFRRLLARWESLSPRNQIFVATPIAFVVLFLVHVSPLFPLLGWEKSLTYAVMECVPVALVLTFATQTELARRERDAGSEPRDPGADDDT